jgi:ATP-dependent DNA helicase PIF1
MVDIREELENFDDAEIDSSEILSEVEAEPPCEFITGDAGSGKTFLVKSRIEADPTYGALCATTGVAAVNLGAVTINSLLGFFDTDSMRDAYTRGSLNAKIHKIALKGCRNIIADEISMMDRYQLDILFNAVKDVNQYKSTKTPMGIIIVGDMAQLPPICKGAKPGANPLWIFKADCFQKFQEHTTRLTKIWRQNDPEFLAAINHLRRGEGSPAAEILKTLTRFEPTTNNLFEGTTILPLNDEVDRHNFIRLGRVNGKPVVVQSRRWGKQSGEWRKNIPEQMQLKIGAFVMLLANDSPRFSYVNGDTGYIRDFDGNYFTIELVRTQQCVQIGLLHRTVSLREPPIDNVDGPWAEAGPFNTPFGKVSYDEEKELWHHGGVLYYPLRLAYASTIHKSQGLSLDRVQIDFRGGFCAAPAMTYISVSRCRSPQGLRLVGTPDLLAKRCNIDPEIVPWL